MMVYKTLLHKFHARFHEIIPVYADKKKNFLLYIQTYAQTVPKGNGDKMLAVQKRKVKMLRKSSCCGLCCVFTLLLRW